MSNHNSRRRRNRSGSATGIIVFLFVAGVFILLSTTVFFNVETLRVTGASNYTAQEIIDASGIKAGDNIVRLNASKCCDEIEKKLVYIEKCTIKRSFPGTLTINVEASVPFANFIKDDNTCMLISSGGKILEMSTDARAGLLNFSGISPAADLTAGMQFASEDEVKDLAIDNLMEYFSSHDTEKITGIDVSDRADIKYTYDGRITVKMGSVNDLEYKMNFSNKIITTKIGDKTEGILTLMSDSDGASFLDKESLENNAKVFGENMAALTEQSDENTDDYDETGENTSKQDPIME